VTAASLEAKRAGTATRRTRTLGVLTLLGLALLVLFGFVLSPPDVVQGDAVRILYIHAPSAWIAYLAFIVTAVSSAAYLWKRTRSLVWDRVAGASAEIGVVFMAITLITGSLWGSITWGTYWRWDPRLTTTALLFITFVGYLAVRNLGGSHESRARRSGVVALLGALEIPLVHFSVKLWRSLHQEASVLNTDGDVQLDGLMLFSVFLGLITFTLLYVWLLLHKQRVLAMQDAVDSHGLDDAIVARRAESEVR
jgi:heme exporter protein C